MVRLLSWSAADNANSSNVGQFQPRRLSMTYTAVEVNAASTNKTQFRPLFLATSSCKEALIASLSSNLIKGSTER